MRSQITVGSAVVVQTLKISWHIDRGYNTLRDFKIDFKIFFLDRIFEIPTEEIIFVT